MEIKVRELQAEAEINYKKDIEEKMKDAYENSDLKDIMTFSEFKSIIESEEEPDDSIDSADVGEASNVREVPSFLEGLEDDDVRK